MKEITRCFEDVLETIKRSYARGEKTTLVIGAGCSVSSGIPQSDELMEIIDREYPRAAQRAQMRTYEAYLQELSPSERRELLGRFISEARVNSAHLAIAHLMKCGFVDRIFTTNFDPLLPRACALAGEFPMVYNIPQLSYHELGDLPEKAIFYVQGQGTLRAPPSRRVLRALLDKSGTDQAWLVVGFSGRDDMLFSRLTARKCYASRLYWVGHEENPPLEFVRTKLLETRKEAYWVPGYNADTFFVQLVRHLGGFSEDFAERLTEHPQAVLQTLSPATQPDQLLSQLATIKYPIPKDTHPGFVAAQLRVGDELIERAQFKANYEADSLFDAAYAHYVSVIALQPDSTEPLMHWAMGLSEQAKLKTGADAERLLSEACEKYKQAATLLPDDPALKHLWGMALARRAQLTRGEPSARLMSEAQDHLVFAEQKQPGITTYFLACLAGSQGDMPGVQSWLTQCKALGQLPPLGLIENNPAFRSVLKECWLADLYAV